MKAAWVVGSLLIVGVGLAVTAGRAFAKVEEPGFTVVKTVGDVEVRRYAPLIEARVTVQGDWDTAVSAGFRMLADYIFGNNTAQSKIAMTAPVAAQPEGKKIAMTAPVGATQAAGADSWQVSFTMPSSWTMDSLPRPQNDRVELVEVPARTVAALRFSGTAPADAVDKATASLLKTLQTHDLEVTGAVTVGQYNPPWIPGWFRRNEVLVPVEA